MTFDLDTYGVPVDLDTIWVKFDGQGYRSQNENMFDYACTFHVEAKPPSAKMQTRIGICKVSEWSVRPRVRVFVVY